MSFGFGLSLTSWQALSGGFSPASLFSGGTVAGAWYDPSDLSTMFDSSSGTTPVAMPGQGAAVPVGLMLDKSGNGNHAVAFNNTTARPELRARVNLLTYSEDQSNGAWINYSATQQSNVGTAPDGTNTADRIVEIAGSNLQARYQAIAGGLGISHTVSAYAKADQRNVFNLSYSGFGGTNWFAATFELTGNGSVTKTGAGAVGTYTSSSIIPVGNGWYFCTVTGNPGQASTHYVYGGPSDTNNPTYGNFGVLTYSGNTANGVLVWGFDVRPANIGANVPAYQRIADALTYDTSGFPLYLLFQGLDDSMYTPANLNLSGTDKVSVFAGVRKLSDAAVYLVAETSSNSTLNAGAFGLFDPASGTSPNRTYSFRSESAIAISSPEVLAPTTYVSASQANRAAPSIVIRRNGVQVGSTTTSQGVGNYGTYPLYIGSRNNASNWLNGHLYSLIIAGSAVSAGNISATESWVAGRTGIQI